MTHVPLATVVLSTRNRAHLLPYALRSLAAQRTEVPYEVVVVDNGSSDGTSELLREWTAQDGRFRSVLEPRAGLSRGKNAGVRAARGELLLFTDDDVVVDAGWLAAHVRSLQARAGEAVVTVGAVAPVPPDLGAWPSWYYPGCAQDVGALDLGGERVLGSGQYGWGANLALTAATASAAGPWNEDLGRRDEESGTFEDTEYQDRVRALGGTVVFLPDAVISHRVPAERISPQYVLATAYARGRNAAAQHLLTSAPVDEPGRTPPLPLSLVEALVWTSAFRARGRPSAFQHAHRAFFLAGWSTERARLLHRRRVGTALARAAYRARTLALTAAPGGPASA